mgnify:CR=1 FL=1
MNDLSLHIYYTLSIYINKKALDHIWLGAKKYF